MRQRRRLRVAAFAASVLALLPFLASTAEAAVPPPVKHVFVVVLENKNYDETWSSNSPAPYLANTLRGMGKLLTNYYGTGHFSLDNYVTMISGQPPNSQTQADCQRFTDFVGTIGPDGVAVGQGCVYPKSVLTIADQLEARNLTWKGYMQDMGDDPVRDNGTTCAHPTVGPTSNDATQVATANDQYAARHNPFVYFHSIIDEPSCATNNVPLTPLSNDLLSAATTASFSFITPDLCNDGHDAPCVNGDPGGLKQSGQFLETWVPKILASPAYADGGMLVITFDEAEAAGTTGDASACCNEPTGPNTPSPGIFGPGGGRIGALVISPFTTPGTTTDKPYNHYSLLRTLEDIYGLDHLGYAAAAGLEPFGADVFDAALPTGNQSGLASAPGTASPTSTAAPPSAPKGTAPTSPARLPTTGGSGPTALAAFAVLAFLLATRSRRTRR